MKIIKEAYDDPHTITITGSGDGFTNFLEILKYMKHRGNGGHSFVIVADPDDSEKVEAGWDGDGVDRIDSIKFDNEEVEQ